MGAGGRSPDATPPGRGGSRPPLSRERVLAPRRGPGRRRALLALLAALLLLGARAARGERDLRDLCRAPKAAGRCLASLHRWWYNATGSGSCQPFVYGGCGRNGNNYPTQEKCRERCADVTANALGDAAARGSAADPSGPSVPSRQGLDGPSGASVTYGAHCGAQAAAGPCRASLPRWYFDARKNSCDTFLYGGCWGNKNNYLSRAACVSRCLGPQGSPARPRSAAEALETPLVMALGVSLVFALLYLVLMRWMNRELHRPARSSRDDKDPPLKKRSWAQGGRAAAGGPCAV